MKAAAISMIFQCTMIFVQSFALTFSHSFILCNHIFELIFQTYFQILAGVPSV